MSTKNFYSNGKLLLTGEYLVIDGATALAIPTSKGQSLIVTESSNASSTLIWNSFAIENECWLTVQFSLPSLDIAETNDPEKAKWLQQLLLAAKDLSRNFLKTTNQIKVSTFLEFPQNWGLGSSSTLINNVAQWAIVDPFQLHFSVSNGSGYDIACASSNCPITYSVSDKKPHYNNVIFSPHFSNQLFFIHLNQKQNSFNEVENYTVLKNEIDLKSCIEEINDITEKVLICNELKEFESLLNRHEYILSNILQTETIKEKLFPLFPGSIKSLGAWGGDFILATGTEKEMNYFKDRGFDTIIPYKDLCK